MTGDSIRPIKLHNDTKSTTKRKHINATTSIDCSTKKVKSSTLSSWLSPVLRDRVVKSTITPAKTHAKSMMLLRHRHPSMQSYIDVGQRSFGKHITCPMCNLLYTAGEEEDEKEHQKFCRRIMRGITFPKWKTERMLKTFVNTRARILEIRRDDRSFHVKKLLEIKAVLDDALGFVVEEVFLQRSHFIYIQDHQVVGCINAERITEAFHFEKSASNKVKLDEKSSVADRGGLAVSSTSQSALVGICQIWVHPSFRRRSIATRLVDIVREKSIYGMRVDKHLVAFAQPTRNGLEFAQKYMEPYELLIY